MTIMAKALHGKIFAVPLPDGTYVFGRVLLDIRAVWKSRLLPHDSPLLFFNDTHLVEMYSQVQSSLNYMPSPVLISGVFVDSREVGKSWPIVGNEAVDPRKVEFPESLLGFNHPGGGGAFDCGEIRYPLPLSKPEVFQMGLDVFGSSYGYLQWPYTCWRLLGHDESEIPEIARTNSVLRYDLRISAHRAVIYRYLPFRMEQSYFEKQAMFGLNFERLYE
jgi:hypothetical protein